MKKNLIAVFASISAFLCVQGARATVTTLALRSENPNAIYNGATTQTVETTFGTNLAALPFTNTTTYDFFSPPLVTPTTLTTQERANGTIYMSNTGNSGANDFTVMSRMVFSDYDPLTGADTLLADTGNSPTQNVAHGTIANWIMPKATVVANHTLPVGHLLHIAVVITLNSGNPGAFGQLLYNGPAGTSTSAVLPHKGGVVWNFAIPGSMYVCLTCASDGCKHLSCAHGVPNRNFAIQATTTLAPANWVTIGNASTDKKGAFDFTDLQSPNYPCRFYRLTAP